MMEPIEILLVEDNPNHAELTVRVLRKHNISNHIRVARDGSEALEILLAADNGDAGRSEGHPARSQTSEDRRRPKSWRRLKADPRTRMIPVVVLTSSREDRDLAKCYALGVNSYIVKPVDFPQFSEAVRELGLYWVLLNQMSTQSPG